jgi:predicted ATP-grasp superfamily ATP-dependent carboligase
MNSEETLLIVGASVRAAAFSARRAGLAVWAADLFADADLCRVCPSVRVPRYPADLPRIARLAPPGPWMYTGALENHPELVDRIAAQRRLLGNSARVLRRVRRPPSLAAVLSGGPWQYPPWQASAEGLPRDGTWIRKPVRSAGGMRIESWNERSAAPGHERGWYFQRRIEGTACAALYVAAAGRATLLGLTEQLVGVRWTHAGAFRYAGSIGPLPLDLAERASFEALGQRLAAAIGLVGLFGVDAILANGCIWPLEVNPRLPASAEVLERALGLSAVRLHLDACEQGAFPSAPAAVPESAAARWHGKAILFARSDLVVSPELARSFDPSGNGFVRPEIADLPSAGTAIRAGWPVMTIFAEAATRDELLAALQENVAHWDAAL